VAGNGGVGAFFHNPLWAPSLVVISSKTTQHRQRAVFTVRGLGNNAEALGVIIACAFGKDHIEKTFSTVASRRTPSLRHRPWRIARVAKEAEGCLGGCQFWRGGLYFCPRLRQVSAEKPLAHSPLTTTSGSVVPMDPLPVALFSGLCFS
jgi:hypothetical protein